MRHGHAAESVDEVVAALVHVSLVHELLVGEFLGRGRRGRRGRGCIRRVRAPSGGELGDTFRRRRKRGGNPAPTGRGVSTILHEGVIMGLQVVGMEHEAEIQDRQELALDEADVAFGEDACVKRPVGVLGGRVVDVLTRSCQQDGSR